MIFKQTNKMKDEELNKTNITSISNKLNQTLQYDFNLNTIQSLQKQKQILQENINTLVTEKLNKLKEIKSSNTEKKRELKEEISELNKNLIHLEEESILLSKEKTLIEKDFLLNQIIIDNKNNITNNIITKIKEKNKAKTIIEKKISYLFRISNHIDYMMNYLKERNYMSLEENSKINSDLFGSVSKSESLIGVIKSQLSCIKERYYNRIQKHNEIQVDKVCQSDLDKYLIADNKDRGDGNNVSCDSKIRKSNVDDIEIDYDMYDNDVKEELCINSYCDISKHFSYCLSNSKNIDMDNIHDVINAENNNDHSINNKFSSDYFLLWLFNFTIENMCFIDSNDLQRLSNKISKNSSNINNNNNNSSSTKNLITDFSYNNNVAKNTKTKKININKQCILNIIGKEKLNNMIIRYISIIIENSNNININDSKDGSDGDSLSMEDRLSKEIRSTISILVNGITEFILELNTELNDIIANMNSDIANTANTANIPDIPLPVKTIKHNASYLKGNYVNEKININIMQQSVNYGIESIIINVIVYYYYKSKQNNLFTLMNVVNKDDDNEDQIEIISNLNIKYSIDQLSIKQIKAFLVEVQNNLCKNSNNSSNSNNLNKNLTYSLSQIRIKLDSFITNLNEQQEAINKQISYLNKNKNNNNHNVNEDNKDTNLEKKQEHSSLDNSDIYKRQTHLKQKNTELENQINQLTQKTLKTKTEIKEKQDIMEKINLLKEEDLEKIEIEYHYKELSLKTKIERIEEQIDLKRNEILVDFVSNNSQNNINYSNFNSNSNVFSGREMNKSTCVLEQLSRLSKHNDNNKNNNNINNNFNNKVSNSISDVFYDYKGAVILESDREVRFSKSMFCNDNEDKDDKDINYNDNSERHCYKDSRHSNFIKSSDVNDNYNNYDNIRKSSDINSVDFSNININSKDSNMNEIIDNSINNCNSIDNSKDITNKQLLNNQVVNKIKPINTKLLTNYINSNRQGSSNLNCNSNDNSNNTKRKKLYNKNNKYSSRSANNDLFSYSSNNTIYDDNSNSQVESKLSIANLTKLTKLNNLNKLNKLSIDKGNKVLKSNRTNYFKSNSLTYRYNKHFNISRYNNSNNHYISSSNVDNNNSHLEEIITTDRISISRINNNNNNNNNDNDNNSNNLYSSRLEILSNLIAIDENNNNDVNNCDTNANVNDDDYYYDENDNENVIKENEESNVNDSSNIITTNNNNNTNNKANNNTNESNNYNLNTNTKFKEYIKSVNLYSSNNDYIKIKENNSSINNFIANNSNKNNNDNANNNDNNSNVNYNDNDNLQKKSLDAEVFIINTIKDNTHNNKNNNDIITEIDKSKLKLNKEVYKNSNNTSNNTNTQFSTYIKKPLLIKNKNNNNLLSFNHNNQNNRGFQNTSSSNNTNYWNSFSNNNNSHKISRTNNCSNPLSNITTNISTNINSGINSQQPDSRMHTGMMSPASYSKYNNSNNDYNDYNNYNNYSNNYNCDYNNNYDYISKEYPKLSTYRDNTDVRIIQLKRSNDISGKEINIERSNNNIYNRISPSNISKIFKNTDNYYHESKSNSNSNSIGISENNLNMLSHKPSTLSISNYYNQDRDCNVKSNNIQTCINAYTSNNSYFSSNSNNTKDTKNRLSSNSIDYINNNYIAHKSNNKIIEDNDEDNDNRNNQTSSINSVQDYIHSKNNQIIINPSTRKRGSNESSINSKKYFNKYKAISKEIGNNENKKKINANYNSTNDEENKEKKQFKPKMEVNYSSIKKLIKDNAKANVNSNGSNCASTNNTLINNSSIIEGYLKQTSSVKNNYDNNRKTNSLTNEEISYRINKIKSAINILPHPNTTEYEIENYKTSKLDSMNENANNTNTTNNIIDITSKNYKNNNNTMTSKITSLLETNSLLISKKKDQFFNDIAKTLKSNTCTSKENINTNNNNTHITNNTNNYSYLESQNTLLYKKLKINSKLNDLIFNQSLINNYDYCSNNLTREDILNISKIKELLYKTIIILRVNYTVKDKNVFSELKISDNIRDLSKNSINVKHSIRNTNFEDYCYYHKERFLNDLKKESFRLGSVFVCYLLDRIILENSYDNNIKGNESRVSKMSIAANDYCDISFFSINGYEIPDETKVVILLEKMSEKIKEKYLKKISNCKFVDSLSIECNIDANKYNNKDDSSARFLISKVPVNVNNNNNAYTNNHISNILTSKKYSQNQVNNGNDEDNTNDNLKNYMINYLVNNKSYLKKYFLNNGVKNKPLIDELLISIDSHDNNNCSSNNRNCDDSFFAYFLNLKSYCLIIELENKTKIEMFFSNYKDFKHWIVGLECLINLSLNKKLIKLGKILEGILEEK